MNRCYAWLKVVGAASSDSAAETRQPEAGSLEPGANAVGNTIKGQREPSADEQETR
jgi:hypothetical protein